VIFLEEPAALRPATDALLREAIEAYEKLGMANAPEAANFLWQVDEFELHCNWPHEWSWNNSG